MKTGILYLMISLVCLLLIVCTPEVTNHHEGTEDYLITGSILRPDGTTPASGVAVVIRPKYSLAEVPENGFLKRTSVTDSIFTDDKGRFAFGMSLDTGTYMIEAVSGNEAVVIDPVRISKKDSPIKISPETLKRAGTLRGNLIFKGTNETDNTFILLFGLDRFARVAEDGTFSFKGIAEGSYDLRILTGNGTYEPFDTAGIEVRSSETTVLDPIRLTWSGIPIPHNPRINYDTGHQIMTLYWDRVADDNVTGYHIYRRNLDPATVYSTPINKIPITDTFFTDTTVIQSMTYEYRIASVSSDGTIGTKSSPAGITITPYLIEDTSFITPVENVDVAPNGDIYIATQEDSIMIYDAAWKYKRQIGKNILHNMYYAVMCIDEAGTIFVSALHMADTIIVFDSAGRCIDTITGIGAVADMVAKNGALYIINNADIISGDTISAYTYDGSKIRSWSCRNESSANCLASGNADTLFVSNSSKITLFDTLGTKLSEMPADNIRKRGIGYDGNRNVLYYVGLQIGGSKLHVIDINQGELGMYIIPSSSCLDGHSIALQKNGDVLLSACHQLVMSLKPLF